MGFVRRAVWLAVFGAAAAAGGSARAQLFFSSIGGHFELSDSLHADEIDAAARGQLERVRALVDDRNWDEAIETLRQLSETHGDCLVAVTERRYLPLRVFCHMQVAAFPDDALALYRQLVDPQAQQWYDDAVRRGDPMPLREIVAHAFASGVGDEALLLLGDMALETGNAAEARGYWEQIIETPPPEVSAELYQRVRNGGELVADEASLLDQFYRADSNSPPKAHRLTATPELNDDALRRLTALWKRWGATAKRLAYPATDVDLAAVRARLALASIVEGSLDRARGEVELLGAMYPHAAGQIGGRKAVYAEALGQMLADAASWPALTPRADWPMFAGAPMRNGVGRSSPPLVVAWRQPLPRAPRAGGGMPSRRVAEDDERPLSYHPIVVGDLAIVAVQNEVRAFRLDTGKPAWGDDAVIYRPAEVENERSPGHGASLGTPRFTLAACGDALLARFGDPLTSRPTEAAGSRIRSQIVGLDLAGEGRLLWRPLELEDGWAYDGAPLSDGERVYVALRRSEVRAQSHVVCYDLRSGQELWRQFVCGAETPARGQIGECTHNLLTLAGESLYFNTNLGAIAAMEKQDGRIRWLTRYPRARSGNLNSRAAHFHRDLTPCLVDRGRVITAPSDSELIVALDAAAGTVLWETDLADDVVHLLGACGDHLWASGRRLWRIRLSTGKVDLTDGEYGGWPGGESPRGYGRGVLAGDSVLWPSETMIHVFSQSTGRRTDQLDLSPLGVQGGNLVSAGGMLLIASGSELVAFGPSATPAESTATVDRPATRSTAAGRMRPIQSLPRE